MDLIADDAARCFNEKGEEIVRSSGFWSMGTVARYMYKAGEEDWPTAEITGPKKQHYVQGRELRGTEQETSRNLQLPASV